MKSSTKCSSATLEVLARMVKGETLGKKEAHEPFLGFGLKQEASPRNAVLDESL